MIEQLQELMKALEAGSYNAAPGSLVQGSALQIEDLSPVMHNVTFTDAHIKLQKILKVENCKSQLVQFNRQLDYGIFGGSAQYEGGVGEEDVSSYVRAVVPMAYYSTIRRVTVAANLIGTFDGVRAEDRASNDAAMKVAGDIEFDCFRGQADFSNAGVFDGNPLAIARVPNMVGLDAQIRQSDALSNTQDLMFAEYGSDQSVVLPANGVLNQSILEDSTVRSAMNMGHADRFLLDPIALAQYNKIAHAKERIVLAGAPQGNTGADLRGQWTSSGTVTLEPSRFLSGKTSPARAKAGSPAAPVILVSNNLGTTGIIAPGSYIYFVTAANERGESTISNTTVVPVLAGQYVTMTIQAVGMAKYYNVYRSAVNGSISTCKFIGRIAQGSGNPVFTDLGNRAPGSITGFLLQTDSMGLHQLSAYSTLKMAISDLSLPNAHFRFLSLAAYKPRVNVLVENLTAQL
jgi:hypothetical protein